MKHVLAIFGLLSVSFSTMAATPDEEAAFKKVLACSGAISESTWDDYYRLAEEGKISQVQAIAISKIINKVESCSTVQIVLETVVAAKKKK